jgi:cell shape-determining protein MreC
VKEYSLVPILGIILAFLVYFAVERKQFQLQIDLLRSQLEAEKIDKQRAIESLKREIEILEKQLVWAEKQKEDIRKLAELIIQRFKMLQASQ